MTVLAVHSTTASLGVALASDTGVTAEETLPSGRAHLENLARLVQRLASEANKPLGTLRGFGVAIGPGSFSGIRVGLATVKGLAVALNKSVVGISSLEILAWATLEVGETGVSVIDARRGEIYVALYRRDRDKLVELGFPMLTGLDQFDAYVAQTCVDVILCGESLPESLLEPRPSLTLGQPSMTPVAACAHLARRRLIKGDADNLHSLVPLYIRRSDAEEKKGR